VMKVMADRLRRTDRRVAGGPGGAPLKNS
jgi:hypothetical protein